MLSSEFAVIDFETTGLADHCRVIEAETVIVNKNRKIADSFHQLIMYLGSRLTSFITSLIGITDAMLKGKPHPEVVMPQLKEFIGDRFCIAHNATFYSGYTEFSSRIKNAVREKTFNDARSLLLISCT